VTPSGIFKSYRTRTSLVRYDLNLTLGCHRLYYLAPLPVLDPIYLALVQDKKNHVRFTDKYMLCSLWARFQSFSNSASLVREGLKSYPRVSEISLSCTPPCVRFYISDEGFDPINQFKPATIVCLSQGRTWISLPYIMVCFVFNGLR
jgi:hypothetical protein